MMTEQQNAISTSNIESLSAESSWWTFFKTDFFGKNYCNFKGRASRKEFWATNIPCLLLLVLCAFIKFALMIVAGLYFLVPLLALTVRRLHDLGWNSKLVIISPIGLTIMLATVTILGVIVNYFSGATLGSDADVSNWLIYFNFFKSCFMMILGFLSPFLGIIGFAILFFVKGKAEDNIYGKNIYAIKE